MSAADDALDWVREDVHIHAPAGQIYQRLASAAALPEWIGRHFRGFALDGEDGCRFTLAIPMRSEDAHLALDRDEQGAGVSYVDAANGASGAIRALSLGLHAEGANDVHVTAEVRYSPAPGVIGAMLEPVLFRPHRRQALRESLWNLKHVAERDVRR